MSFDSAFVPHKGERSRSDSEFHSQTRRSQYSTPFLSNNGESSTEAYEHAPFCVFKLHKMAK